jgi:hypothetical protein
MGHAQKEELYYEYIRLGRIYATFNGEKNLPVSVGKQVFYDSLPESQKRPRKFLFETLKSQNNILTDEFLILPDSSTLKTLYIVRSVAWNQGPDHYLKDYLLVDSLFKTTVSHEELVSCYYNMLFFSTINKRTPFYLSKYNFIPENYNLKTSREKAIFFLESVSNFFLLIDPEKIKNSGVERNEANNILSQFPNYNGLPYYRFTEFDFETFSYAVNPEGTNFDYKLFYLYNYFSLLNIHVDLLGSNNKTDLEWKNIIEFSILNSPKYQSFNNPDAVQRALIEENRKWLGRKKVDRTKQ